MDVASDTAISSADVSVDTALLSADVASDTAILSTDVAADTAGTDVTSDIQHKCDRLKDSATPASTARTSIEQSARTWQASERFELALAVGPKLQTAFGFGQG